MKPCCLRLRNTEIDHATYHLTSSHDQTIISLLAVCFFELKSRGAWNEIYLSWWICSWHRFWLVFLLFFRYVHFYHMHQLDLQQISKKDNVQPYNRKPALVWSPVPGGRSPLSIWAERSAARRISTQSGVKISKSRSKKKTVLLRCTRWTLKSEF